MVVKWNLKSAGWTESILLDKETPPIEVATQCIEKRFADQSLSTDLSIILELNHSEMNSESEHLILLTSSILANAGFYSLASELEREIDKVLHNKNEL
jgi:hypothetical protein